MAEQAAGTVVNSAGTLISSILESVGYHYQANLLDQMTTPLTDEVGGLIYVFAIALAVVMTATQGQYKMGVWLLIGPPMFFASILPRGEIDNASWRFGRQIRDDAEVNRGKEEILKEAGQKGGPKANVSKLFAAFVKMVSVTDQEMVHTIAKNRKEADLALVVRAELFSQLHISLFNKPGLERLFHRAMLGNCGKALEYARAMNDPLYRPAKFSNPNRGKIDDTPEGQQAKLFFENRKQFFKTKFEEIVKVKDINLDGEMAKLIAGTAAGKEIDFEKIEKLQQGAYTCIEIWNITINFIQEQAAQDLEKILSRGAQIGVSKGNIVNILKQAHGIPSDKPVVSDDEVVGFDENDLLAIKKILAKYLIRNEARKDSWGSRIANWITGMETQDVRMRFAGKESFTEQARTSAQEWSEKERMINAAATLPYYQGLGLFVLSAVFPFFALLLLIPGKQSGFFLWFILWIWLKSWDVAMAAVMLLDDVVFGMLSVQMVERPENKPENLDPQLQRLDLAFSSLNEIDPTFQLSTYYSILATAILAVPPATAHVILGGLKGGASLIAAGLNRSSMQAGGMFLGAVEQGAVNALRNEFFDVKRERIDQYQNNVASGRPQHDGVRDERGRQVYPSSGNPVKAPAFSNSAFGGLYNAMRTPHWMRTNNASSDVGVLASRQRGILNDAERAGAGAGLNLSEDARMIGKVSKNPNIVGILAKSTTAADRRYGGLSSARNETLQSELSAVAAQAIWDAEIEPIQMHRVNLMSVMGSLAIPSPNFALTYAGGEGQQEYLMKKFSEDQGRRIADWGYRADVSDTVIKSFMETWNSLYDDKRASVEGISNLYGIDANTAKAIEADYAKLNGEKGKKEGLTATILRNLSPSTKGFIGSRMLTQSPLIKNSNGSLASGTGMFASDYMKKLTGEVYGSAGNAYGRLQDLTEHGVMEWGKNGDREEQSQAGRKK